MVKKPAKKAPKPEPEPELITDEAHAGAATEGFFAGLVNQFSVAWLFLTRIPLPGWWNKPVIKDTESETDLADKGLGMTPLADTVRAWPLVGIAIGALSGGTLWLAANAGLHPLAASFLGLAVAALATGALHEDGLADLLDGFGGGDTKAKKLRIMRDSNIGTFGVMGLVVVVGFKAGTLASFTSPAFAAAALLTAHVLSRAMLPMLMVALPPARRSGLGQGAGVPNKENAMMTAGIGVLVAVLAIGPGPGLVASVLAGLSVAAVGWLANRHIQGFTGDVLGAAQQISEAVVLAGVAVMLRTLFYA